MKRQLIIHVKVLAHYDSESKMHLNEGFEGVTKLAVMHSFKGRLWTDTLLHINMSPSLCGSTIRYLKVYQEAFLKAGLRQTYNTKREWYFDDHIVNAKDSVINNLCMQYQNISTGNCDVSIIPVVDGQAKGRITKNTSRQWKTYKFLIRLNETWAEKYYARIANEDTRESISMRQMYNLIRYNLKRSW